MTVLELVLLFTITGMVCFWIGATRAKDRQVFNGDVSIYNEVPVEAVLPKEAIMPKSKKGK